MAQDDYGAAQPIIDVFKGAYKKVNDLADKIPTFGLKPASPSSAPDSPWHDEMVKEATKSIADQQAADAKKIPTQTMAQKRISPSAKPQAKLMTKPSPRKR